MILICLLPLTFLADSDILELKSRSKKSLRKRKGKYTNRTLGKKIKILNICVYFVMMIYSTIFNIFAYILLYMSTTIVMYIMHAVSFIAYK